MKHSCQLYLITPPSLPDLAGFAATLEQALASGEVAAVQLRLKGPADPETGIEPPAPLVEYLAAARRLVPVIQAAGAAAIINDLPQVAADSGADGTHLGQKDASLKAARALLGPSAVIGVTCHDSRDLAMSAGENGADYVAFGAFFDTSTKKAPTRASVEVLEWWAEIFTIPCVAIGGVTSENCAPLVRAGADFLAVSSAVWTHSEGPAAAVSALTAAIKAARAD